MGNLFEKSIFFTFFEDINFPRFCSFTRKEKKCDNVKVYFSLLHAYIAYTNVCSANLFLFYATSKNNNFCKKVKVRMYKFRFIILKS